MLSEKTCIPYAIVAGGGNLAVYFMKCLPLRGLSALPRGGLRYR